MRILILLGAYFLLACLAAPLIGAIIRTGRGLEEEYDAEEEQDDESALYLDGSDDGSGTDPHMR